MASKFDRVAHQQTDSRTGVIRRFGFLDDERAGEVAPAVRGATRCTLELEAHFHYSPASAGRGEGHLQNQGASERAVCVTGHVRRDCSQGYGEADGLRVGEPEAYEPTPCVGPG